jgi:hypothetical protein
MSQFIDNLPNNFGLNKAEADSVISCLGKECASIDTSKKADKLDYIELFLAVSLNAKLRGATNDARYKKLKIMLNNNSSKAVNLANLWVEGQISFDKMLATI